MRAALSLPCVITGAKKEQNQKKPGNEANLAVAPFPGLPCFTLLFVCATVTHESKAGNKAK